MSLLSRSVTIRVPRGLYAEIGGSLSSLMEYSPEGDWCLSLWVQRAIQEKLDHMRRSRGKLRRKRSERVGGLMGGDGI
jgi:hypothetical protein